MTSKIDLYREVLAIEPNSRVFFPLAKMLVAEGGVHEALEVLRSGITFHPDHLEAKFLLVELHARLGQEEQAATCFEAVCGVLSGYPALWAMWANRSTGLSADGAVAMRFLAAAFRNQGLTWAGVMEKGLAASATQAETSSGVGPALRPFGVSGSFNLRGAEEVMALTRRIEVPDRLSPECVSEAAAAVKTKTMAELLARHGDYASALEIYEELSRLSGSDADREQIALRVREITALMAGAKDVGKAAEQDKPKAKARLVSMLETLADRLDARAAS